MNYPKKLSDIYNALSAKGYAKKTPGGMWYETHGIAIYKGEASWDEHRKAEATGTEVYKVRVETDDTAAAAKITCELQDIFKDTPYVTVDAPRARVKIGPRS